MGQFGDSSDASSATKSLSFGIGYPQGTAGETSMYTDSWTPVGSKTDSNASYLVHLSLFHLTAN